MSFFGSNKRTPPKLGPPTTFATREQIIALYVKYRGEPPSEAEIQSHLGNPGGAAAIEALLAAAGGPVEPTQPPVDPGPPANPQPDPANPQPTPAPAVNAGPALQVTNAGDGRLINRGQSYWSQVWLNPRINAAFMFVGHESGRPQFFKVDRATKAISRLGALLPYTGEGEGWYYDETGLIYLIDGSRLRRVDPFNTLNDTVVLDISQTHPGCDLWQAHSSADGRTHCATVRQPVPDGPYPHAGTVVSYNGNQLWFPVTPGLTLDESAVTDDGNWLIMKEGTPNNEDNRIVDLKHNLTYWVRDRERAVGHSDVGRDYVIGEADKPDPGMVVKWDLPSLTWTSLYETLNMGHVCVRRGRVLVSTPTDIRLIGTGASEPLTVHGMVGDWRDVDYQVAANMDPSGTAFVYLSNHGGGRLDLFYQEIGRG